MIQHLCLYKFMQKYIITTKETSKIIKASIYDSVIFNPMVAKYSLISNKTSGRNLIPPNLTILYGDNSDSKCSTHTERMEKSEVWEPEPIPHGLLPSFLPLDPALKMLHAFQHFVYFYTHGQMPLTDFKGNPPSSYHKSQDFKTKPSKFINDHYCTEVCEALHLPEFFENPWIPVSKKSTSFSSQAYHYKCFLQPTRKQFYFQGHQHIGAY
ncbi:AKL18 protein [Puccinia sorghi]|uniref:AKL18 protein n=1 Tax=Puccinia sorghi TaxID=27349 RepID=A0A0L6VN21_9BASI|nr:AKL18 protein [Puccinia sorghi]